MHSTTCYKSCGGTGGSETSKIARVFSDFGVGFIGVGTKYGVESVFDRNLINRYFLIVEVGTGFISVIEFVEYWEVNNTSNRLAVFSAGDLGAPNRQAISEIDSAVDRIDNKAIIRSVFIRIKLFAHDGEVWIVLLDFIN